jgi:ABC-type lipoprotein export system ATPase subunit/CRP-like cAMP-binding protein
MFTYFKHIMQRWLNSNGSTDSAPDHDPQNNLLIDLRQVVKIYETPAGPFTAISGIDLQVSAGEFVAVIGKSGSGKSTLINMITGIDRPTLGEIIIAGTPVHQLNETQIARWRGRNVGVIFQFFQLLPTLSLIENVMLPMEFCGLYSIRERQERGMHLLDLVGIADQAYKLPAMVSGGQQQRAAIARALANDPKILVADEPTGSLDSKTADTIFELFEDFVAQGKTILMVTHDRDLASRVTRVVLIADGQIVDQIVSQALPSLDQKLLVDVSSNLNPSTFAPNSWIFRQGDAADHFYIIIKGQVEIVKQHASGQEIHVGTLSSGQYFGEMGLMGDGRRTAGVRASGKENVVLMALDRESFARVLKESDLTSGALARLMRQRLTADQLRKALEEEPQTGSEATAKDNGIFTYQPLEVIIRKGDPAEKFYLIVKGAVEVMHPYEQDVPTRRLVSGQYFGEIGLLEGGGKRTRTVRAAPDIEGQIQLIAIGRESFEQLTTGNKMIDDIALTMQQYFGEELKEFGYLPHTVEKEQGVRESKA